MVRTLLASTLIKLVCELCKIPFYKDQTSVSPQEQCGSYTFLPYIVTPQGKVLACDPSLMKGINDLMQPSFMLEPLLTPLVERLVHLLDNVHIHSRSDLLQDYQRNEKGGGGSRPIFSFAGTRGGGGGGAVSYIKHYC